MKRLQLFNQVFLKSFEGVMFLFALVRLLACCDRVELSPDFSAVALYIDSMCSFPDPVMTVDGRVIVIIAHLPICS